MQVTSKSVGKVAPALALLLPLAVFSLRFRYVGGGDATPAELLPISILNYGTLDFNAFVTTDLPYWFKIVNGRVVSNYPILPGLLNVPAYFCASLFHIPLYSNRALLSMLTASTISAASVLLMYLCLRQVCRSPGDALLLALVYAFATCVWSVTSRTLLQHGPSLLLLSGAILILMKPKPRTLPIAGLLLALAVANRPTNALIALPLIFYVWKQHRNSMPAFLLLAAIPAGLISLYSAEYLGTPFSLGQTVPLENFSGNVLQGIGGLLLSPSRGLFVFSPFLLFVLPATVIVWRRHGGGLYILSRHLLVGAVLLILTYSMWVNWWGGHSFGYRLIIEILPSLMLLLAAIWEPIKRHRLALVGFLAAVAWSVYVHFLGAMAGSSGFNQNIDFEAERLWYLRESEIVLSTRKLMHRLGLPVSVHKIEPLSLAPPTVPTPAVRWWSPVMEDPTIPGWYDSPVDGSTVQGRLHVDGWARSRTGDVDVHIVICPGNLSEVPRRYPRPDVAAALPDLGDVARAGFEAYFDARDVVPRRYGLFLEFRDQRGGVRQIGPIMFRWGK